MNVGESQSRRRRRGSARPLGLCIEAGVRSGGRCRATWAANAAPAPRAPFWIAPGQHAPERSRSPAPGCHRDRIPPPAARAHQLPPPCSSCTPWTPCAFVARGETRKKPSGRDGRSIQGWDRGRCQEGYRRLPAHVTLTCAVCHPHAPSQVFRMSPAQATKSTSSAILPGQQSREPRLVSRMQSRKLLATKSTNVIQGSNLKLAARGVKPQPSPSTPQPSPRHPCGPL